MLEFGFIVRLFAAGSAIVVIAWGAKAAAFYGKSDPAENAVLREPELAGELAPILEPIRRKHKLPALAAAIIVDGEVRAIGATGARESGGTSSVTIDDLFHIGSCTKAMTATMLATLVEEGRLSWSTTVRETFPDLDMDEGWGSVTLEALLHHRGGAPEHLLEGGLWRRLWECNDAARECRMKIVRAVTAGPPGEAGKYVYSNAGYSIAGAMAEEATGQSWEALMRERVFEPLGMQKVGFGAPGSAEEVDEPRGHTAGGVTMEPGPGADNPQAIGPAGTVHGSLRDWARFVKVHLGVDSGKGDEEKTLVSAETLRRMHSPAEGPGEPYAMGWIVTERAWARGEEESSRGIALTHGGSNTFWYAVAWLAPERDLAVLVATNQGGGRAARACDEATGALLTRYVLDPQGAETQ
ncbi:MAG: class A beta-lactamase-related serine hydrolase [Phycisphaerales bacterium]|nr:MAG: class A beta-lactamase-related serine hydrolase [Phycisphaerales bacterium]